MKQLQLLLAIIPLLMLATIPNVSAGGPRLDYYSDSTKEGAACWVDGYDSGFAGKYDRQRADECSNEKYDEYNVSWDYACRDGGHTEEECNDFKNNPVDIEDFEALKSENDRTCYDAGIADGEAGKPFNIDRSSGCSEFGGIGGGYKGGYQFGCETHTTENSCELLIEGEENFCPDHPDIVACVNFLHNATNKIPESPVGPCSGMGDPRPGVICLQESNPEKYCLRYDNPVFCNTIGDLCDPDGFVKPEYPYCTK